MIIRKLLDTSAKNFDLIAFKSSWINLMIQIFLWDLQKSYLVQNSQQLNCWVQQIDWDIDVWKDGVLNDFTN